MTHEKTEEEIKQELDEMIEAVESIMLPICLMKKQELDGKLVSIDKEKQLKKLEIDSIYYSTLSKPNEWFKETLGLTTEKARDAYAKSQTFELKKELIDLEAQVKEIEAELEVVAIQIHDYFKDKGTL